jgi:hypothetical protein
MDLRNLGAARRRVNEKLAEVERSRIGDDDWDYAIDAEWASAIMADKALDEAEQCEELADEIAGRVIEWRDRAAAERSPDRGSRTSGATEGLGATRRSLAPRQLEPVWWRREAKRLIRRFDDARVEILALLGLTHGGRPQYLAVSDVKSFLVTIGDSEAETGDWVRLDVPLGFERAYQPGAGDEDEPLIDEDILIADSFAVWRGYSLAELRKDGALRRRSAADLARQQRLARLADLALEISERTGCSRAEAVCYLLCDVEPRLPYIDISYVRRLGGVVIVVRDPRVSARDLSQAFAGWGNLFWQRRRQPRRRSHDVDVVQFVEAHKAFKSRTSSRIPWEPIWRDFDEAHRGHYEGLHVLQNRYYVLRDSR